MKQGILLKLLAINVPVVALVILVLWLVLDTLQPIISPFS